MNEDLCRQVLRATEVPVTEITKLTFTEEDSPGLSYSSILQRFKITIAEDDSHHVSTLYVILKSNPDTTHPPDSLFDQMFNCEIKIYKKVFPVFQELFDRCKTPIIWPKLYAISEDNQILMEDLKVEKYKNNMDHYSGSSLEEAELAINALAQFHASSIAAKSKGSISNEILEPYFYCRNNEINNKFFKDGLRILTGTMKQSWDISWSDIVDKLEKITNDIGEIFVKLHHETDDKFRVINHGDYWRANLMYKYDDNNTPISFRFVDFQLSHFGSIGWDLAYFLFLNPNLNLVYKHRNHLLETYYRTQKDFLDKCGCQPNNILSQEEIKQEFDRFLLYGFLKCCTDLPYQTCTFEGGIDAENLFKYNEETERLKVKIYSADKYVRIIKTHMNYLKENNIL